MPHVLAVQEGLLVRAGEHSNVPRDWHAEGRNSTSAGTRTGTPSPWQQEVSASQFTVLSQNSVIGPSSDQPRLLKCGKLLW